MEVHKTDKLSSIHFENLNGLRFVGALSVFLFHCFTLGREMWGSFSENDAFKLLAKIMSKGHYGVSLFFVLSGFLITYLLLHEAKVKGKINVFGFFMRRLLRIWPVYFIVVVFGFFIFPQLKYGFETTNSLTHYLIFASNFEEIWNGWRDSVNFLSITWSVSIEEQFYIAWVVLMTLLPFMRKGKNYLSYLILVLLISVGFRFMNLGEERVLYFHTFSVMSDLAIGGILSWLCFFKGIPDRFVNINRIWIVIIYMFGTAMVLGSTKIFQGPLEGVQQLCIGLFFAFVIAEQVFFKNSFFKADNLPYFKQLGEISYGFYMYHCIVIYFTQKLLQNHFFGHNLFGFITFIFISYLGTYIISKASYSFIEQPLLRLKKHFR